MSYHLAVLAHLERRLTYAAMQPKINHVPGQGLWPRAESKITCKNYDAKRQVNRDTVKRSHRNIVAKPNGAIVSAAKFKRPLRVTIKSNDKIFNDAEKQQVNAAYVALMDSLQAAQQKRIWL